MERFLIATHAKHSFLFLNGKLAKGSPALFSKDNEEWTIPKNTHIEDPIYLIYVQDLDEASPTPRQKKLILQEQSRATIVEYYINLKATHSIIHATTTIELHPKAELTHLVLQKMNEECQHISEMQLEQAAFSRYCGTAILLGGKLNQLDFVSNLNQPQANSSFGILEYTKCQQHQNINLTINHHTSHCESKTVARSVANDHSKSNFTGKIIVHKNAIKSKAALENKNLLLSFEAEAKTCPQLEIYNEDVQCSHGATVGHLERDALFYLKSRGIPEQEARQMLISAFISPGLQNIQPPELLNHIETLIYDA